MLQSPCADAARAYEKELAKYKKLYPSWHEGPPKTKPARPMRPFDCFVAAEFEQRCEEHPHLAYLPKYKVCHVVYSTLAASQHTALHIARSTVTFESLSDSFAVALLGV